MNTDALLVASHVGDQLRYVTEHLRDLQGLRLAPVWVLLMGIGVLRASTRLSARHVVEIAILLLVLFVIVWLPWSNAWYNRRYGMVEKPAIQPNGAGLFWAMIALTAIFVGTAVIPSLDPYRGSLNLWAVLLYTVPRCFYFAPATIVIRLRRALYIAGSLSIIFLIGSLLFLHPSKWIVLAALCSMLLLLNLYDHWLLDHLLNDTRPELSGD